jgi:O-antigen ligase
VSLLPSVVKWLLFAFIVASFARLDFLLTLKIGALTALAVMLALLPALRRQWSSVHTAMALFLLHSCAATFYATNGWIAYRLNLIYIPFVVVSFGIAWVMSRRESAGQMVTVWALTIGYIAAYTIARGGSGPGGYVGDENDTALLLSMALPFALFGLDKNASGRRRLFAGTMAVLLVAGIVATMSRGGVIALAAVAGFFWFVKGCNLRILFGLIAAVGLLVVAVPDEYLEEVRSIYTDTTAEKDEFSTAQQRFFLWTIAINAFKDHPVLGVGPGNFRWVAGRYQPTDGDWPTGFLNRNWTAVAVTHSFYFTLLSEHGAIGCALLGFLIYRFFRQLQRVKKARGRDLEDPLGREAVFYVHGAMGAMVAFLAGGVFISVLEFPHFWYLIAMGLGIERAYGVDHESRLPAPGGAEAP